MFGYCFPFRKEKTGIDGGKLVLPTLSNCPPIKTNVHHEKILKDCHHPHQKRRGNFLLQHYCGFLPLYICSFLCLNSIYEVKMYLFQFLMRGLCKKLYRRYPLFLEGAYVYYKQYFEMLSQKIITRSTFLLAYNTSMFLYNPNPN